MDLFTLGEVICQKISQLTPVWPFGRSEPRWGFGEARWVSDEFGYPMPRDEAADWAADIAIDHTIEEGQ
jgi:hypothetical protein